MVSTDIGFVEALSPLLYAMSTELELAPRRRARQRLFDQSYTSATIKMRRSMLERVMRSEW
jgi:hypothetical protein